MENLELIPIFLLIYAIAAFGLYKISKAASKFYAEASELENQIKTIDDKENQINTLFKLKEKSFHRRTGERLTQLAKMMEIKYDIKLVK